jgi:hypothetical protein
MEDLIGKWKAEISPAKSNPSISGSESWMTDAERNRYEAIAATLRSFSISRQFLTETKFSSSERLIRYFEGITASTQRNPTQEAFDFTRRSFEGVVRYGINKSLETDPVKRVKEEEESRLLTLQAFHNLAVIHHRRWLQIWEEQPGSKSRKDCASLNSIECTDEMRCEDEIAEQRAREMATLSYESAHRFYECVIANGSVTLSQTKQNGSHIRFFELEIERILRENGKRTDFVSDVSSHHEESKSRRGWPSQEAEESDFETIDIEAGQDAWIQAADVLEKLRRIERGKRLSYVHSLLARRTAVLLASVLGLLELIVQGRKHWPFGDARLNPPHFEGTVKLRVQMLLKAGAEAVRLAELCEALNDRGGYNPQPNSDYLVIAKVTNRLRWAIEKTLRDIHTEGNAADKPPSISDSAVGPTDKSTPGQKFIWEWFTNTKALWRFLKVDPVSKSSLLLDTERTEITLAIKAELEKICYEMTNLQNKGKFVKDELVPSRLTEILEEKVGCLEDCLGKAPAN